MRSSTKPLRVLIICLSLTYAQVDTVWTRKYSGTDGYNDLPCGLCIDGIGNVYVTGYISVGGPTVFTKDVATLKYGASGDSLWVNTYNGLWGDDDYPVAVEIHDGTDIYVCGACMGMDATFDYAVIKYDTSGVTQWAKYTNGPWGDHDYPADFTIDDSGHLYVTGHTSGAWTGQDMMTVKYNSAGDTLWMRIYNHNANRNDVAAGLAVDEGGNTYITGRSWDYVTKDDYVTIKYDAGGNEEWVVRYNGPVDSTDCAEAIAVNAGDVYVTGSSWQPASGKDIVTVRYDMDGDTAWTRRYNGSGNGDDGPVAITTDASGSIYVTGYSKELTTDFCTIKYDGNGDQLWVRTYNGPGNDIDRVYAMTIDDSSNIYVTGESRGAGTFSDFATVKYDPDGNELWVARYNGISNGSDRARAIALDDNGYVYVTGESFGGPGAYMDYLTIKYSQATGVEELDCRQVLPTLTLRNSIFSDDIEIVCSLPSPSVATLRIYDAQGRLVRTLVDGTMASGIVVVRWQGTDAFGRRVPCGAYLMYLSTKTGCATAKAVRMR